MTHDTFSLGHQQGYVKEDLLKAEAKFLFLAGAVALGVYGGYSSGVLPTIVSSGVAGAAMAKHGFELGNATAGGELPGAIIGACTGMAGLGLGVALGSGLVSHLTGIHLDHQITAGLLGATSGLLAYSAISE